MQAAMRFVAKEFMEVLPAMIYFFLTFALLVVTDAMIRGDYGIATVDIGSAVFGALVVGKILLIVDRLPFIDRFPNRPLIYNVLWKTLLYNLAALLFRYLEKLVHLWIEKGSFGAANEALFAGIDWSHFWLLQIWLGVLFFVYAATRELIRKVGGKDVRRIFLGV